MDVSLSRLFLSSSSLLLLLLLLVLLLWSLIVVSDALEMCPSSMFIKGFLHFYFFIQDKKGRGSTAECLEIVKFVEQQTPLLLTSLYVTPIGKSGLRHNAIKLKLIKEYINVHCVFSYFSLCRRRFCCCFCWVGRLNSRVDPIEKKKRGIGV